MPTDLSFVYDKSNHENRLWFGGELETGRG